ncbi:MAG: hypothetical protein Q4E05_01590 [Pseudoclavibacter sp.]|nr:hypothetical protein [Pseudoclavibacter sp.]
MSVLTMFLAPDGALDEVRDALSDWSAAGLVEPFMWIRPSMLEADADAALLVEAGRCRGVSLQAVAGRSRVSRVRICALVPALAGLPRLSVAEEMRLTDLIDRSFGRVPVTRVRAIVARDGEDGTVPGLVVGGWHNIVVSPEDSIGPGLGRQRLGVQTPIGLLCRQAAATAAGLLGLWRGAPETALDAERMADGERVRIGRSYFRRLATDEVAARLREGVLSMHDGLPLPAQFGVPTVYVPDEAAAAQQMSDRLWTKHAGVLRGPREQFVSSQARPIRGMEALRMFLGFLWAALKRAPKAWLKGIVAGVQTGTANALQGFVFGSEPAAYQVVIGGVVAGGMPAGWTDFRAAVSSLDRALDGGASGDHAAYPDLSGLWQDYAAAAMTLADAGERAQGLAPLQIGGQPGIMRRVERIVPGAALSFHGLPPHVAAGVGASGVEPFDVLGAHDLQRRMRVVAEQPLMSVDASGALERLGSWRQEHGASFASRVGERIAGALTAVQQEIRTLYEQLSRIAAPDDLLARFQERQQQLTNVMWVLGIMFVVGIAVAITFGAVGLYEWWTAVLVVLGLLLLWFVAGLIVFLQGQRDLFAFINRRREVQTNEEIARRNLQHALRDAKRLADAYLQFLAWSRIIGAVLANPFGERPRRPGEQRDPVAGLPLSSRVGRVVPQDEHIAQAAARLRRDLFSTGWLGESWSASLAGAAGRIGPRGVELEGQPLAIYRDLGDGRDSLLNLWAASLLEHGVDPEIGEDKWRHIMQLLQTRHHAVVTDMLRQVRDSSEPEGVLSDYETFMSGIDRDPEPGDRLDDRVLTDAARARGLSRITASRPQRRQDGLDRTAVLVQLSEPIDGFELRVHSSHAPAPSPAERTPEGRSAGEGPAGMPDLFGGTPF